MGHSLTILTLVIVVATSIKVLFAILSKDDHDFDCEFEPSDESEFADNEFESDSEYQ